MVQLSLAGHNNMAYVIQRQDVPLVAQKVYTSSTQHDVDHSQPHGETPDHNTLETAALPPQPAIILYKWPHDETHHQSLNGLISLMGLPTYCHPTPTVKYLTRALEWAPDCPHYHQWDF